MAIAMLLSLPSLTASATAQDAKPNFIVIYTDDHQFRALGANGNPQVISPSIDRLASQGMRFTQARVVLPLCSPSRASLLTGRYASGNGVDKLDRGLKPGEKTFVQHLKQAGYRAGLTGKWHLGKKPTDPDNNPLAVGFDVAHFCWSNGPYYNRKVFHGDGSKTGRTGTQHIDEWGSDRAVDFLRDAVKNHADKPFVLYHNTQTPHLDGKLVWDAKASTLAQYKRDEIVLPKNWDDDLAGKPPYLLNVRGRTKAQKDYGYGDPDTLQQHTLEYYAVITELDDALGRLFKEIDRLGLRENTYIILMGDNGWLMGDHGMTSKVFPYDASSRVPLIVAGPGIKPGSTSDAKVLNIDIAPTLLTLASLEVPSKMHGINLSDQLLGSSSKVRDAAVLEILGGFGGNKPILAAFDGRYELILTYEEASDRKPAFTELYDLDRDPWELNNLADDKEQQAVRKQLESAIEQHRREVLNEE